MGRVVPPTLAAVTMAVVSACARQGAPPGGPRDRRPPVVVSTVPDTFAVDTAFKGPVRFDFDERISERTASGNLDEAVVVSPYTGKVKVSHSRSGLEVKVDGGFRRGVVYRVTLLPVIRDMFNNRMHDPFDLIFSTGAPFVKSAVAGMVWDRITGKPMKDMLVMAEPEADTTVKYVARSDTGGIYIFRYLPPAHYRLVAFEDRNRNHEVDPTEARGLQEVTLAGPDTVLPLDVAALRPDTAPARVRGAVALDSLTVMVNLDHYVDPDEPDSAIHATLRSDSVAAPAAPGVRRVYKEYDYTRWVDAYRDSVTLADSIARAKEAREAATRKGAAPADTTVQDTATARTAAARALPAQALPAKGAPDSAAAGDTVPAAGPAEAARPKPYMPPLLPGGGGAPPRGAAGGKDPGLGPDGRPLPKQRIVLLLDSALVPGMPYTVEVHGVTTVNGIAMEGGDTARVVLRASKDTTTTGVGVDSAKAKSDSAKVKGDSAKATKVKPDTSAVGTPPDTSSSVIPYLTFAALPGRGGGE